ncbi:uncharacterized protein LOC122260526 [Penaeus japonicus]|uniref:uncharacterized protein LOC122260526 n=1 Tax=Penaeus japonicus TaxID=27405 RepID=UPI001C717A8B|nr:uncharacterized protein LOC122260526 [Penaeus japonicus]
MTRQILAVVVTAMTATWTSGLVYHERCLGNRGECVPQGQCPFSSGQLSCPDGDVCCLYEERCRNTLQCLEMGGKCSYTCQDDDDDDDEGALEFPGLCKDDCMCCVKDCAPTSDCSRWHGRCSKKCGDDEEDLPGLCGDHDDDDDEEEDDDKCTCCVKGCVLLVVLFWSCKPTADCKDMGGICSYSCKKDEIELLGFCVGDCKCCVKERPCSKTSECKAISGRCDERCNRHETPYEGLCVGKGCLCCVRECKRTDACKKLQGRCDQRCNRNEIPLLGYCVGDGCFCCVKDVEESSKSVNLTPFSASLLLCPSNVNEWSSESSLTSERFPASAFSSTHNPSMNSAVTTTNIFTTLETTGYPSTKTNTSTIVSTIDISTERLTTTSTPTSTTTSTDSTSTTTTTTTTSITTSTTSSTGSTTSSTTTSTISSTTTSTTTTTTPIPCDATADCEFLQGQCRLSCPQGTQVAPGCRGPCVCCVPDGLCLNTSSECRDVGGTCVLSGPQLPSLCDAVDLNLCSPDSCACCVDCKKQTDPVCKARYDGSCKAECNASELPLGTCQEGCNCCGCQTSGECGARGGRCVSEEADCKGVLAGECAGESCFCCLPKGDGEQCWWETPRCSDISGRCASSCDTGETRVEGLCGGGDCVCCTSDPTPCLQSTLCSKIGGTCQSECPSYMREQQQSISTQIDLYLTLESAPPPS